MESFIPGFNMIACLSNGKEGEMTNLDIIVLEG
jgi:hypothetical protein